MSKSELVVGLDIGTTKICAVVGVPTIDGVDIVGIGTSNSSGLRKGVVVHIEETVSSIQKALQEAELMADCEIKSVYAGIAGSHIQGTNSQGMIAIKGEEVTDKDIERAIDAAKAIAIPLDREVIHVLPQEFAVDDHTGITHPRGMAGVRLEVKVHIVTGSVTSTQNILRTCHRSGLDVSDIVLESMASARAVLTEEERKRGSVLIDIGGGTTDIAVFLNDSIRYTNVLPLGGQNLTNDIAYGLRTTMQCAEDIKLNYGCVLADLVREDESIDVPSHGGRDVSRLSRRVLADICQPRMEELLALANQELNKSQLRKYFREGVVLTGGATLIEGCQELAEHVFNLPVRIGRPRNIGGLKDVVDSPKYATAVGLLLYGVDKRNQNEPGNFTIGEGSMFGRVFGRMKKWFSDIS